MIPPTESVPGGVRDVVAGLGEEFARFDSRTQDSGHVSYGVVGPDGRRWFVKTGRADHPRRRRDRTGHRVVRR